MTAHKNKSCLFSPLELRGLSFKNRIAVSPMCQYSSEDGFPADWHLVHLGSRAIGGAAMVMMEAAAVEARGRITPADMGIWKDDHAAALEQVAMFLRKHGSAAGIQLAHAGRKASTRVPWEGGAAIASGEPGGWVTVAPSPIPFHDGDPPPAELTRAEIRGLVDAFAAAAVRARKAGFQVVEIHGAHGYLIHEFLSPLANHRSDEYGGSFDNRIRFALEVVRAVRSVWPGDFPVWLRISCTDWVDGGWDLDQSIELARRVRPLGIDLIDCSSGGMVPGARIPLAPGYQVAFAGKIRRDAEIPTGAVGLITEPQQAEAIVESGQADMVLLARAMLRDPYWPLHAARALGVRPERPVQYGRAFD